MTRPVSSARNRQRDNGQPVLSTWEWIGDKSRAMSAAALADRSPHRGYRFLLEIIAHAVWL